MVRIWIFKATCVISHDTLRRKQVSKTRRKPKKKAPPPRRRSFTSRLVRFGIKAGILALLIWAVAALAFYAWALTYDIRTIIDIPQRSTVYDKDGKIYSRLAGENRVVVPFDKISNNFVNALLAREDTRFYYHHGIDPIGIARAIVRNFIAGGFREGASTITQQLARNSFPLGGKTLSRKLIEAALAYRIETELSKEEILSAYMNRIYFGSGYYGVETASQAYFGKPASRMTLPEAAMLAGLIRSPNRFSPFTSVEKAVRERNTVLSRMAQLGFISEAQRDEAQAVKPEIAPRRRSAPQENWAMDSILRELDLVIDRAPFDDGGLKIYTTIDGPLQDAAEASVRRRLEQIEASPGYPHRAMKAFSAAEVAGEDAAPYLEAAALAVDSRTGGIRAIVGGRDYDRSKFNRALLGSRQVGSAVKPFVYAKAFEQGLKPGDRISDNRLEPGEMPAAYGRYNPGNSDQTYRGDLPASEGLVLSRNTMSVRVGLRAGLDAIADTVIRSGLSPNPPRYPALCLGAFESSLKDLTAAYTTFATGGTKLQPYLIERVADEDGRTLYKATRGRLPVLKPEAARVTSAVLEDVVTRGTASRSRALGLRHRAAGKTGTTNDYQDAWFVGFDNNLVCGVWVGFDRPVRIMRGGTGAELALPIWVDVMEAGR
jgi:penicillin-binding protein 1A